MKIQGTARPLALAFIGVGMNTSLWLSLSIALLAVAASLPSQGLRSLTPMDFPDGPSPAAFDVARGRIVVFGGGVAYGMQHAAFDETWEFDGVGWHPIDAAVRPAARAQHAMTFDPIRNRTLLFGGRDAQGGVFSDTWWFDGSTWMPVAAPSAPTARYGASLVFDWVRGRSVLVGGTDALGGPAAGTWEFDGVSWSQATAQQPGGARGPLAFDLTRGRVVMHVGGTVSQTWEYDGALWMLASPVAAPPASFAAWSGTSRASGQGVMMTGRDSATGLAETWSFDGVAWSRSAATDTPEGALLHDVSGQRNLLLNARSGDVCVFSGSAWNILGAPVRAGHALAFDSRIGAMVLFGGTRQSMPLQDTWVVSGSTWVAATTPTSPSPRYHHAMVYDSRRGRTVLFGGTDGTTEFGDTWGFDGATWSQIPVTGPSPRHSHGMAYDSVRDRVVLFGGTAVASQLAETWEFDGGAWMPRATATNPPAGSPCPLVYDSRRGVIVHLSGGGAWGSTTWHFDGVDWSLTATAANSPFVASNLVFDAARGRVVMSGGLGIHWMCGFPWIALFANTYEYDGVAWQPAVPTTYWATKVVYDPSRHRIVGAGGTGHMIESLVATSPTFTHHGLGCLGSAGTPSLDTTPNTTPALGTTFPLQMTSLPPSPSFAYLALGFDLATWNGIPLPIDLAAIGMPNCKLWVEPLAGALLSTTAGTASFALPIPALPALAGQVLGAQALSFDAQAPSGFATVSNGAILRLY